MAQANQPKTQSSSLLRVELPSSTTQLIQEGFPTPACAKAGPASGKGRIAGEQLLISWLGQEAKKENDSNNFRQLVQPPTPLLIQTYTTTQKPHKPLLHS